MSSTAVSTNASTGYTPKILVITTNACSYPGVDNAGQQHLEYPTNSYIVRVPSPVLFPEEFFLETFRCGIDGILIMSCGEECPYTGAFHRLSLRVNRIMKRMKEEFGLEPQRLKLTAICTVCAKHVVKEISAMDAFLRTKEPAKEILSRPPPNLSSETEK